MSNVDTLTRLLEEMPEDDITAYLLTDALMEERDMTRTEADRTVRRVRQAVCDARDIAQAAALIRPDSPERAAVMSAMRYHSQADIPLAANFVLLPGSDAPLLQYHYRSNSGTWWYDWTVTVGASWLLASLEAQRHRNRIRNTRAANRRARNSAKPKK